jgi:hypothetical protein
MMFTEVKPNEEFDLRRFQSLPLGRWETVLSRMLFGKFRVRLGLCGHGWYAVDYWGGDLDSAALLYGFVVGVCLHLPEQISEQEINQIFPEQNDKELGRDFWKRLNEAGELARSKYDQHKQGTN